MENSQNLAAEDSSEKYKIKIEPFEGPLDLLLHLIKTSEIDIYDIPIAEITKQYLDYLSFLVVLNLDNITEFVEMASTLILIKSRAMLPVKFEFEEEYEDPREELIAKLLEYQKYKIAAGVLETKMDESIPFVKKNTNPALFNLDEAQDENWRQLSVLDLIGAFAEVLNKNEQVDRGLEIMSYNFSVEDKKNFINELLQDKESFQYFELIKKDMPKVELVCIFLALLELVKKGTIIVRQHVIFGDIHIVKQQPKIVQDKVEV